MDSLFDVIGAHALAFGRSTYLLSADAWFCMDRPVVVPCILSVCGSLHFVGGGVWPNAAPKIAKATATAIAIDLMKASGFHLRYPANAPGNQTFQCFRSASILN